VSLCGLLSPKFHIERFFEIRIEPFLRTWIGRSRRAPSPSGAMACKKLPWIFLSISQVRLPIKQPLDPPEDSIGIHFWPWCGCNRTQHCALILLMIPGKTADLKRRTSSVKNCAIRFCCEAKNYVDCFEDPSCCYCLDVDRRRLAVCVCSAIGTTGTAGEAGRSGARHCSPRRGREISPNVCLLRSSHRRSLRRACRLCVSDRKSGVSGVRLLACRLDRWTAGTNCPT
jgi:hypothetical protein